MRSVSLPGLSGFPCFPFPRKSFDFSPFLLPGEHQGSCCWCPRMEDACVSLTSMTGTQRLAQKAEGGCRCASARDFVWFCAFSCPAVSEAGAVVALSQSSHCAGIWVASTLGCEDEGFLS